MISQLKITGVFIWLCALTSWAQQNGHGETLSVIENIYKDRVDLFVTYINDVATLNKNAAEDKLEPQDIYKGILRIYESSFNEEELKELMAFYRSPLGKKWLEQNGKMDGEVALLLSNEEKKRLGIKDPEPISNEEYQRIADSMALAAKDIKLNQKAEFPKIDRMDELRAYLLEHPNDINNLDLLRAILGPDVDIDKLLMPDLEVLENNNKG